MRPPILHADGCATNLGVIGAECNCGAEAQRNADVEWFRQVVEEGVLSPERMEQVYQDEYKKACEFSDKYHSSLSRDNFHPERPADRQRSFDVTHRKVVMLAISRATVDEIVGLLPSKDTEGEKAKRKEATC